MTEAVVLKDEELIAPSRKYGSSPDSLRTAAYCLFDQNYTRAEVRFLLRSRRKPDDRGAFGRTVAAYHRSWEARQGETG